MFELTRRELELQMDVVKSDLGKLRYIKDQHNEHLRNLIKTLESYHEKSVYPQAHQLFLIRITLLSELPESSKRGKIQALYEECCVIISCPKKILPTYPDI
jgi:methionyl-tRNA formyltransferase